MIVIPAINCSSADCFSDRLELLSRFSPLPSAVHIDISHTPFSSQNSYWNPEILGHYPSFTYEAHVMKSIHSHEEVKDLLEGNLFSHLYFHPRAVKDDTLWDHQKSVPVFDIHDTREDIISFFSTHVASHILVLAVSPGASGQTFSKSIDAHIATLREVCPHGILSVDGGIDCEIATHLRERGVTRIISGSFIWEQSDPSSAYRELITR